MWCGKAVINRFMEISQKLNVGVVLNECDRNGLRGEMLWKKNHTYIINIDVKSYTKICLTRLYNPGRYPGRVFSTHMPTPLGDFSPLVQRDSVQLGLGHNVTTL
jgi:hypothetical protein